MMMMTLNFSPSYLVCNELQQASSKVIHVPYVLLIPQSIPQHQGEKYEETKEMSPDIDCFVVNLEDAPETIFVLESLSVAPGDRDFLVVIRNFLNLQ